MALSPTNKYADKAAGLLRSRVPRGHPPAARNPLPSVPSPRSRPPRAAAPRPPATPAAPAPYAPLSPEQIAAQARTDIYGPYNNIIDATVKGLLGQTAYQSDLERSRTSALMAALAPYANRIRGIFNPAAQQAQQAGQGIGATLAAQGGQLAGELGGKLAGIKAPGQAVDLIAGGANRVGQAAGATLGALGTAESQRLHGVGEANAGYAEALPGVTQLESLARLGLIRQDLAGNLETQIGKLQIEAERAYIDRVRELEKEGYDRQTAAAKAKFEAQKFAYEKQRNARKDASMDAYRRSQVALAEGRTAESRRYHDLSVKLASGRLDVSQYNAMTSRMNAGTSQARLNQQAARNAQLNAQAWTRLGISQDNLKVAQAREDRLTKTPREGGFTAGQVQKLTERAANFAQDAFKGYTDKDTGDTLYGTGTAQPWKPVDAWKWMLQHGFPPSIAQRALRPYAPQVKDWYHPKAAAVPSGGPSVGAGGIQLPTSWSGTHVTDDLGWGTKTAEDIMGSPGTPVGAPEDAEVVYYHPTGAQGGGSMLLRTPSGREYWLGHITGRVQPGTRVRRGQLIAVIANQHVSAPHVHIDHRG